MFVVSDDELAPENVLLVILECLKLQIFLECQTWVEWGAGAD